MHHGGASQGVKGQGVKLAIFALGKENNFFLCVLLQCGEVDEERKRRIILISPVICVCVCVM